MTRCMAGSPWVLAYPGGRGAGARSRAARPGGAGGVWGGGPAAPAGGGGGRPREERPDHQTRQGTADDLGGDERQSRRGRDAGERGREHAADGDRGVGETGGG